jgi:hypothetical protein
MEGHHSEMNNQPMKGKPMKTMLPKCYSKTVATLARVAILIIATAFLAGCGSRLSGTYVADANGMSPFEKLNFTSGSKVELTHPVEGTVEANYVVEGDKVKITVSGQTLVWTIDKSGSLNSDGIYGKYTKQ